MTATSSTRTPSPERDTLLHAVEELAPLLAGAAAEAEEQRRLPGRVVEAMRDAGLYQAASPRAVGGLEIDPATQIEVYEAATAAETAAGWNLMTCATALAEFGCRLGDEGAADVFGDDARPIAAGQIAIPLGTAEVDGEGYRVSGRWPFGTGVPEADWVVATCIVSENGEPRSDESGQPQLLHAAIPSSSVTIHDTWHVAGLKGTGSFDYAVDNVPVRPPYTFNGYFPGAERGGPWCHVSGVFRSFPVMAGFPLGVAQRLLQELDTSVAGATRTWQPSAVGNRESFHVEYGRHLARYEAARAGAMAAAGDLLATVEQGGTLAEEQVNRSRSAAILAMEVAVDIAQFAFRFAGTKALFDDSVVQRYLRDVLAGQQHLIYSEFALGERTRARLGIEAAG